MTHDLRISVLLAGALLAGACGSQKERTTETKKEEPAKKTGLDLLDAQLAGALRMAMAQCKPPATGELIACPARLTKPITIAEEALGPVTALERYCSALQGVDRTTRAVIATRMGTLSYHRALAQQPSDELHSCLVRELKGARDPHVASLLIRPAVFLATAKKKEGDLFEYLDGRAAPEVKRTGYECLWVNGRMRVLAKLQSAIASEDAGLRQAVATGFVYVGQLRPEEARACELLGTLLEDKDAAVAGVAATQVARLCPDRGRKVVELAESHFKEKTLDARQVTALHEMMTASPPIPEAEAKRIMRLLVKVVSTPESPNNPAVVREAALRLLGRADARLAAKLEKQFFPKREEAKKKDEAKPAAKKKEAKARPKNG